MREACAERSTMGKKIWYIHLRKLGYDVAYKTTPGKAVSWLTVVESYIGKPNEGQLTAVKMGHV